MGEALVEAESRPRRMYVALHSYRGNSILAVRQDDSGQFDLPGVAQPDLPPSRNARNLDEDVEAIIAMQCGVSGIPIFALRFLGWWKDDAGAFCIVEAEPSGEFEPLPEQAEWLEDSGLDLIASDARRTAIKEIVCNTQTPRAGIAAFESRGWRESALAWIDQTLSEQGPGAREVTEGRKTGSSWNCVLRILTAQGREFYFKAVRGWNRNEPRITTEISRLFPGRSVEVSAVNEQHGWMLTSSTGDLMWRFGDDGIRCPAEVLENGVRQFAELQIESADHAAQLITAGCPDRGDLSPGGIAGVFSRLRTKLEEQVSTPLSAELLEQLGPGQDALTGNLSNLDGSAIPACLVHSDFHAGNMGHDPQTGHAVVFDWGDCSTGHPFISLHTCVNHPSAKAAGITDMLRRAYLDPWRKVASDRDIRSAAGCARWLHALNELELVTGWLDYLQPDSPAHKNAILTALDPIRAALKDLHRII